MKNFSRRSGAMHTAITGSGLKRKKALQIKHVLCHFVKKTCCQAQMLRKMVDEKCRAYEHKKHPLTLEVHTMPVTKKPAVAAAAKKTAVKKPAVKKAVVKKTAVKKPAVKKVAAKKK